jgi:acetyl esterase/lipase
LSRFDRSEEPRSSGLAHALFIALAPARFPTRAPTAPDVVYASGPRRGVPPLCDVYVPSGPGPHPSVVLVHGGGFVIGHRRMKPIRLLASRLSDRGYVVCSIDYRLLFRGGGLAEQVADVGDAARFWRSSLARFDCDPDRVSMVGLSAGASLMMLHAGQTELRYHRLVSIYGPASFDRVSGRRASLYLGWVMGTRDREVWKQRSPLTHATMDTPLLLIHGTADQLVPVAHAERLHAARLERGLPTELELVEGMPHGWLNDASLPQTEHAVKRVLRFLGD